MKKRMSLNVNRGAKEYIEARAEFMKYCKLKNLSEATVFYYEDSLMYFTRFLEKENFKMDEVTIHTIEDYTIFLNSSDIKSVSVNTRLRGLRAFLYWCMDRGYVPAFKIRLVKQEEVIKSTFSDEELLLLLKKPDVKSCTFPEFRNWAMVNFLLATGVRVSTLIAVRIKDVDLYSSVFRTKHNKNRREQILPISKTLNKVLSEYLIYRKDDEPEAVLFCNQYGKPFTTDGCEQAVREYGNSRGVSYCGPHKFRHSFAKNWILSGGDVFRLQKMLGHSSLDVVKKYVNLFGTDLQSDIEKFNPLDRLAEDKTSIKMDKSMGRKK